MFMLQSHFQKEKNRSFFMRVGLGLFCLLFIGSWAEASTIDIYKAPGAFMWSIPFMGLLLSIACGPLIFSHHWHHIYSKIALLWVFAFLLPFWYFAGSNATIDVVLHTLLFEYFPFIILVGALYIICGGIHFDVNLKGSPLNNTVFLAIATFFSGWLGTTGASILFIRPFIRMNQRRNYKTHQIIFFIFLVSNVGGALTPLGDPPLFVGFLKGIDFLWPLMHLSGPMVFVSLVLLILFFLLDNFFFRKEHILFHHMQNEKFIQISGHLNCMLLLAGIVLILLTSSFNHYSFLISHFSFKVSDIIRDSGLVFLASYSWIYTKTEIHKINHFSWGPLKEVAQLFFAIFLTVIPVIALLQEGAEGPFGNVIEKINQGGQPVNILYFWLTGIFSSFLDNAPTYLIFFHLAGGDSQQLMGELTQTLKAISLGAVFMGAMTYIGNAPNFMVKSIAETHKISMPSFFVYIIWSCGLLLPVLFILSWIIFKNT